MPEPITFRASFPPIQSAIRRSGNNDGLRIQLDIPETDVPQAVMLLAMVQERLRVTIEIDDDSANGTGTVKRSTAKRRV